MPPAVEREAGSDSCTWWWIKRGNASEPRDVGWAPGASFLFALTVSHASESVYPEMRLLGWESIALVAVSGAVQTAREKRGEGFIPLQAVPITASGLQGEKPLVNRTM